MLHVSRMLQGLTSRIASLCRMISIVIMAVLSVLVFSQVILRFVFSSGAAWIEEFAMISMMWVAFLGGSLVFADQSCISVTILIERLQEKNERIVRMIFHIFALVFFCFLLIYGVQFAILGLKMKFGASGIPKFWSYLSIPVGALFSILFELDHLLRKASGRQANPGGDK
ncbi:TRAP transporter small permease [uncultured Oscillibacter sp.]|uniref:TRAP transporter small permease n=2 Tax=uncultured Oscillibacter sp. TaxID=876091 RepID=UPI002804E67A|nr:TRAP transporter small permease [uncultured Oscillibacter sp.]